MTIELSSTIETQLKRDAQAQGISVAEYIEHLVAETNRRKAQISQFRAAIAERMNSLRAGEYADGEEVMTRLAGDLPGR